MARVLTPVVVLSVLALAGCIQEPTVEGAEVFVLEYALVDLATGREQRSADPGHHCGDVSRQGDTLTVHLWPDEERSDGPWLAIFPHLPDHWRPSIGAQPFKTGFPAEVLPRVDGDEAVTARLEWEPKGENGTMRVDEKAVALPHSWSHTSDDGSWRMDATLAAWRGPVTTERYGGYCD